MKEIKQLLEITKKLRDNPKYQGRKFSLDGKLVGDKGEVLVAEKYGIKLFPENDIIHDGEEIATGRKVQIKKRQKNLPKKGWQMGWQMGWQKANKKLFD